MDAVPGASLHHFPSNGVGSGLIAPLSTWHVLNASCISKGLTLFKKISVAILLVQLYPNTWLSIKLSLAYAEEQVLHLSWVQF